MLLSMDLGPQQVSILERLHKRDFRIVAFPMYANYVGVRKGNCAALLAPVVGDQFKLYGQPAYLLCGNFSVRVTKNGADWFIWKKEKLEVTPARRDEISSFTTELADLLFPTNDRCR